MTAGAFVWRMKNERMAARTMRVVTRGSVRRFSMYGESRIVKLNIPQKSADAREK
jgi:hypothetical protein